MAPDRAHWLGPTAEGLLIWAGLILLLYALHDVFAIVLLTFLLVYLVRAIVVPLAGRISPGQDRPGLERWLTLATFGAMVALLWGLGSLVGPQLVLQGRLLTAHAQHLEPEELRDHLLARTLGAYLFGQTYGTPEDPRYQAAFAQFAAQGRAGEGAFADFGPLQARVQAGFEMAYEEAERARLRHQLKGSEADGRALEQWRGLRASPEYAQAFQAWFEGPQGKAIEVPYDRDSFLALSAAYGEGAAAFNRVYRARVIQTPEGLALARLDFQRAKELELARQWWAASPAAASLRAHLEQDATGAAARLADRVVAGVRTLIAIPAQVGTALLLTILISFDMAGLKRGALRLGESRLAGLYGKVVPSLVAVARLIGRSFAAQGVIAVFNTLLTLALMRLLGLGNELLLGALVFIASFIPVLGIILSGIPIALQALLQPDGSLILALYALLGIAAIHAIESMVLSPRIVGRFLHLHPVLVLAVLVIGEHLFGIWGLLLGVPVAVYAIHAGVLAEPIPGIYEPATRVQPAGAPDPVAK